MTNHLAYSIDVYRAIIKCRYEGFSSFMRTFSYYAKLLTVLSVQIIHCIIWTIFSVYWKDIPFTVNAKFLLPFFTGLNDLQNLFYRSQQGTSTSQQRLSNTSIIIERTNLHGYSGHFSTLHNLTSLVMPPLHWMQYARIALIGVSTFIVITSFFEHKKTPGVIAEGM